MHGLATVHVFMHTCTHTGVTDHRVLSNRSMAHFAMEMYDEALKDSITCCYARPFWAKVSAQVRGLGTGWAFVRMNTLTESYAVRCNINIYNSLYILIVLSTPIVKYMHMNAGCSERV